MGRGSERADCPLRQQNVIGSWGWRSGLWESDGANQCGNEVARVEGRGR